MRVRDPLLYEQYIGQYLSEEEIMQRSEESMRSGTGGLADLLINSYQEKLIQNRLEEEQEREQCAVEESDEEGARSHWLTRDRDYSSFVYEWMCSCVF